MSACILVIEDDPHSRELALYLLRRRGHEMLAAGDGAAGLKLLLENSVDLVLCDLQMPRMDGFAFIREVRAETRFAQLPALAVTAFSMPGDRDQALAAGFTGYLSKPIDPAGFCASVERHLPPGKRPA